MKKKHAQELHRHIIVVLGRWSVQPLHSVLLHEQLYSICKCSPPQGVVGTVVTSHQWGLYTACCCFRACEGCHRTSLKFVEAVFAVTYVQKMWRSQYPMAYDYRSIVHTSN